MIHHDLTPNNIMLTTDADLKIILQQWKKTSNSPAGTAEYMAPEVLACSYKNGVEYNDKADMWSLGITDIKMAEGHLSYSKLPIKKLIRETIYGPPPSLTQGRCEECLQKQPARRPSARQLLSHPFIRNIWDEGGINIKQHIQRYGPVRHWLSVEPMAVSSTNQIQTIIPPS
ncbi:hypothetical protein XELAEV_18035989mg [Xenopus laevis]|uniref:Protein kinase domain-containing protein n=1 Tax=Xenopus laevis TaxID=8355 RepID=A0A974HCN2_XENLA|nr:hypothetical protein XELAEV_18035989mg [Xenopus laevis]